LGRLLAAAAATAALLGAFAGAPGNSAHADASANVGDMERVQQTVYGTPPNGQQLAKHQGDGVVFHENIETWAASSAQLRFIDGSHLTLGSKAKVLIDEFVFDPSKAQGNALIKISAGTLRWVTGAMPKGQTVIKTPTATLTLRGTDVTVHVHPNGTTDAKVHDGIVDNHNDLTNTDTTMGPGDSQTSDQTGNHTNNGDGPGDPGDPGDLGDNGDTHDPITGSGNQATPPEVDKPCNCDL